MKKLEEKAKSHADKIFSEIIDKYQTGSKNEFRDALARIYLAGAAEGLASQWRSVEDEWPDKGSICLCRVALEPDNQPTYLTALFDGIEEWEEPNTKESFTIPAWIADYDSITRYEIGDEVTHWMPIPEPPETKSI